MKFLRIFRSSATPINPLYLHTARLFRPPVRPLSWHLNFPLRSASCRKELLCSTVLTTGSIEDFFLGECPVLGYREASRDKGAPRS
jgi:hypothetical protein